MNTTQFQSNPAYTKLVELLHELHKLMRNGKGDSDEADQVRDQMDAPWYKLDSAERARFDGMSADLYTLESKSPIQHANSDRFIEKELSGRLALLIMAREWDRVLELLRESPEKVSWDLAAQYRAEAYAKLGDGTTAKKFLAEAWRLNPKLPDLAFVDAGIRGILV